MESLGYCLWALSHEIQPICLKLNLELNVTSFYVYYGFLYEGLYALFIVRCFADFGRLSLKSLANSLYVPRVHLVSSY